MVVEKVVLCREVKKSEIAGLIRKAAAEGQVALSTFHADWVKASRYHFRQEVDAQVQGVVDHAFADGEIVSFTAVCKKLCADLVKIGRRRFEKAWAATQYLGKPRGLYVEIPEGEWGFRLAAAQRGAALNSGQMAMACWESLALTASQIPGAPTFAKAPPSQQRLFEAPRKQARGFAPAGAEKMEKTISSLMSKPKELKTVDKTFAMDFARLDQHAVDLLRDLVERMSWLASHRSMRRPA